MYIRVLNKEVLLMYNNKAVNKENEVIPLNELIDKQGNVYEMTCVAIKEANIYAATDKGRDIEAAGDKVVSVVLDRALNDEIEYTESPESDEE